MHWSNSSIFYHIYPLGFCGAPLINDNNEVNRILKVKEWVPHLKACGINALYLGPVFDSSEHGYDTRDYFKVDQRLGSNEAFKEVCDCLHENGIRIVLDGVFNHVGRDFWAFKDLQKNHRNSAYRDWFMNVNFDGQSPCGDDFWYEGWNGHYNLVKLNLRNQEVCDMIMKAIFSWIDDFHVDGLRLDAADVMDKDFFKRLAHECKAKNPDFWLMGEVIHGDYKLWINDQMLDSTTNYECYKGLYSSHNDANYFEIAHSLNRQFGKGGIYQGINLYNFVDNHDVNRLASTLRDEEHLENVYTLLFTMPGIPSIYYGSEVGLKGARGKYTDFELRPCLSLEDVQENDLMRHINQLAKLKKTLPALQSLNYEQICVRNRQFVFKRSCESQEVYVALNLDGESAECIVPCAMTLKDCLSGDVFESQNGSVKLCLEPKSSMVLMESLEQVEQIIEENVVEETVVEEVKASYHFLETIESFNHQIFYVYEDKNHKKWLSDKKLD